MSVYNLFKTVQYYAMNTVVSSDDNNQKSMSNEILREKGKPCINCICRTLRQKYVEETKVVIRGCKLKNTFNTMAWKKNRQNDKQWPSKTNITETRMWQQVISYTRIHNMPQTNHNTSSTRWPRTNVRERVLVCSSCQSKTLGTQDTGHRHTKHKNTIQKTNIVCTFARHTRTLYVLQMSYTVPI